MEKFLIRSRQGKRKKKKNENKNFMEKRKGKREGEIKRNGV